MRVQPSVMAVAGWLTAALAATGVGVLGIRLAGDSLTGGPGDVLTPAEVAEALAAPAPPAASGPAGASPAPSGAGPSAGPSAGTVEPLPSPAADGRRSFTVPGGSVIAACVRGGAWLESWTPNPGYQVSDLDRGPDDDVKIRFGGPGGRFELRIECRGTSPVQVADD